LGSFYKGFPWNFFSGKSLVKFSLILKLEIECHSHYVYKVWGNLKNLFGFHHHHSFINEDRAGGLDRFRIGTLTLILFLAPFIFSFFLFFLSFLLISFSFSFVFLFLCFSFYAFLFVFFVFIFIFFLLAFLVLSFQFRFSVCSFLLSFSLLIFFFFLPCLLSFFLSFVLPFFLSFFAFPFPFSFSQIVWRNININWSDLLLVPHTFLSFYMWIPFTFDLTSLRYSTPFFLPYILVLTGKSLLKFFLKFYKRIPL